MFALNNLKLFQHQQQALTETEGQNKVAYYLDMGLGKTFVGAEKLKRLDADALEKQISNLMKDIGDGCDDNVIAYDDVIVDVMEIIHNAPAVLYADEE